MDIENELNNQKTIDKNNFLKNIIGQTVNGALDIGLKSILPDLIENQVIEIKNALVSNGLKSGIDVAIDSATDFVKSTKGIFTGNFENIEQVKTAIGEGGIVDTISVLLDKTVNKITDKGYINDTISGLIKGGKNIILENIENNIRNEINIQENQIQKLDKDIKRWESCYEQRDFDGMTDAYNDIISQIEKTIPVENIIKNINKVYSIHNLIKNNGQNFEISNLEKELAEKLII